MDIEDDLLKAVRSLARDRSVSMGTAVSELIRKGLEQRPVVVTDASGIPCFSVPPNSRPITLEDVKRIEDEA